MHRIIERHNTRVWGAVAKCLGRPKLERPKEYKLARSTASLASNLASFDVGLVLLVFAKGATGHDTFVGSGLFTLSP